MKNQTVALPFPEGNENLRKRVFRLAMPAVGEQLLNTLVGLTDIFLVGNLSATASAVLGYSAVVAVAGLGLGNQASWLVLMLFMAAGVGSTALIARAIGARNVADQRRFLQNAMLVAIVLGVLSAAGMLLLGDLFLTLIGAPPEVHPIALTYLSILAIGMFPTAIQFVGMACLRGAGDTRTPLYMMLGVNVANVAMTWLLVNGEFGLPVLGVAGAAIATTIARCGGGIAMLVLLLRGHSGLRMTLKLNLDLDVVKRLLRIAAPTAGELLVFQSALILFVRFVTGLGTVSYAAHIATININSTSFLPGMGYAAAVATLVGQGLGAQRPDASDAAAREGLLQGMLLMVSIGAVIFVFPHVFLGFFVNDAAAIAVGTTPLRIASLLEPAIAISFIMNGALRGAGDTRFPLFSRMFTTWGLRLPLTVVFVTWLGWGLVGIWCAMAIDFSTQAFLAAGRFKSGVWQKVEV